ncbi:L-fucose:H+ symporter permease [Parabacteroides sp. OttesenSCG-928-K15]|nr:L-fucose:H+ symporter permease [Parabacteroides sp. OttesenSCG-928-K15]
MTSANKRNMVDRKLILPFILVTFLFFLWGIPNNLNGILIKQFMKSFELSVFQASLIQSVFYLGYFVFAFPAAMVMQKYNYKIGLIGGLLVFAIGCLLFWPAAIAGSYLFFLTCLFIIASGLTFLETGANSFIVQLGDKQTAEQRLNFSQAFNPLGSITGVVIGTVFIFSGVELSEETVEVMKKTGEYSTYLEKETLRVVVPYLFLAVLACLWAILLWRIKLPEKKEVGKEHLHLGKALKVLTRNRAFMKGVLAQFLYVGAQVGTWSYFILYVQQYTGETEKVAGYMLSGTLIAFALGRLSATWLMKYVKPVRLMSLYSLINVVLVAMCIFKPGPLGMWCLLLTSFFMSLMYPTLFALGVKGLGEQTKVGGSVMVMAILGGAVITPLMGLVADFANSLAVSMIIPLIAYVYIFYYSFRYRF